MWDQNCEKTPPPIFRSPLQEVVNIYVARALYMAQLICHSGVPSSILAHVRVPVPTPSAASPSPTHTPTW